MSPVENRTDEQDACTARIRMAAVRPSDAWRYHMNPFVGHVQPIDQLPSREPRDRQHGPRSQGGMAREPAPADAFARAEPFGMSKEGQIMDRDDERHAQRERC